MRIASRKRFRASAALALAFGLVAPTAARADENADDNRPRRKEPAKTEPAQADPAKADPTKPDPSIPRPDTMQPTQSQPGPQSSSKAKSLWELSPCGYIRFGYDHTFKDDRYEFVGRNNGFVLRGARVGLDGKFVPLNITWRISIEGASDVLTQPNTPQGTLSVRLRDAFARWDPFPFIGIQAGQFKAPFQEEELKGANTLLFVSRAVGVDGVPPGRGLETPGIQLDRQVGVMLSPSEPIGGDVAAAYYLMVMNGNGSNQLLDDNGKFGIVGRTELGIYEYVRLGAALFHNTRTVGDPPNLYNEEDFGLTGDLTVKVAGLSVLGAVTRLRTVFPTVGTSARAQLAFHGQAGYRIELPYSFVMPAYRYAYFHPWQDGGGAGFDQFKLQYHTFGIRTGLTKLPVQAWINYTLTVEETGRKLGNDRIEILGQVTF